MMDNFLFRVLNSGNLRFNNARIFIMNTFDVGLFGHTKLTSNLI